MEQKAPINDASQTKSPADNFGAKNASSSSSIKGNSATQQANVGDKSSAVFTPVPNETSSKPIAAKASSSAPKVLNPNMSQQEIEGISKERAVVKKPKLSSAQNQTTANTSSQNTTQSQVAKTPIKAVPVSSAKKPQIQTPQKPAPIEKIQQTDKSQVQTPKPAVVAAPSKKELPTAKDSEQDQSALSISAPNPNAANLPEFAEAKVKEIPEAQNLNTPKPKPATTAEQYLDQDQKATGSFLRKLFGFAKKEKTAEDLAKSSTEQEDQKKLLEAEKTFQKGLASVRDLIAPSSMEIHYDHLKLSGIFARSFFVYAYPRYLETSWLSPIVNFDAAVDISQFIYPISSADIMRTLKKKVAQIQSSITMSREKGNVRDPAMETALEDAEQLRTDLQRGQEKFFQFGFYFTVYAEDQAKLDAVTKRLENLLAGKLVLTKRADAQGEHAFNSTLPLAVDELEIQRNMNTSPLSTTFPFISSNLATDDGILYGLNRHNNSLIIFDRFQLPNANSVVFASSGAGKSYAVKLEVLRQVMLGTDVIIIDPENEYEALAQTVDGTYLRVSLNSEQRINPFDLPAAFEGQDLKPGDLLRENVITLTGLMKLMLGKMTAAEDSLIDKALIDTYAVRGITMETEDPTSIQPPTMEDFHSVLSSMKGAEDLAQRLQKYTSGTFGGIFNKPTNVDLNSGLVIFCIRDLEDELRPIAMYILLNYIWNRVRSEMKKRLLVIDEAWTMMQHTDAAKFLFGLVKRARKYYLGITTITQDVEDFLGSPYGRPVVTNSSMQLLLKQAPSSMDVLQKTFNLTDGEKYMLLNSGVGQGLFFADNKHVAIQVIASYSENQIVTTNPEEILKQRGGKD